jgi:hypothetical protein
MAFTICPNVLVWGDLATWITGIATFSAVYVALRASKRTEEMAAAERLDIARVFAPAVARELRLIRYHCDQIAIVSRSQGRHDRARWEAYCRNLNALSAQTLQLVAERTIYRGDAGRALIELYGEMLRVVVEREELNSDDGPGDNEPLYIFGGNRMESMAKTLKSLSEAALTLIWPMLPDGGRPIPDASDPYG